MPGKYSHSVVLADYSNRGLIVLPQDQYETYVQTAPRSLKSPAPPSTRLRGTRSAQAIYRPPTSTLEGWDTLRNTHPHPSLSTSTTPVRARVKVSEDEDELEVKPKRISRYFDQLPRSTPAVHVVSQSEPKTAYERQQMRNGPLSPVLPTNHSTSTQEQPVADIKTMKVVGLTKFPVPQQSLLKPKSEVNNSNAAEQKFMPKNAKLPNRTGGHELSATSSHISALSASTPKPPQNISKNGFAHQYPAHYSDSKSMEPRFSPLAPETQPEHADSAFQKKYAMDTSKQHFADLAKRVTKDRPSSVEPSRSREIRNQNATSTIATPMNEPSFDGFSDRENEPPSSYTAPKPSFIHSRESSTNSTLPIQRPETQDGSSTKTAMIASPRSSSLRQDRSTPSRATATSTVNSRRQESTSSVSSMSVPNGYHHGSSSSKTDQTKTPAQTSALPQNWALPDINEDHGFSPSIFEDSEGIADKLKPEDFGIGISIGHISSGKDVSYDNDTASELSAALPPPINRFKDEEDEFNANMTRLFGNGGDISVPKKSAPAIGRRPSITKKSKGFFSKFRSKG